MCLSVCVWGGASLEEEAGKWLCLCPHTRARLLSPHRATPGVRISSSPFLLLYLRIIHSVKRDFSQRFVFLKSS